MRYSEECKNRLVYVAKSSQVFLCNSILRTYPPKGLCHLKRCGNKWDLMIQILFLTLPGFILCFFLSLSCPLVSGMGFCYAFLQLIFITGTCKVLQASLRPFIISHRSRTAQGCRKSKPHGMHSAASRRPYETVIVPMHIPALHLHSTDRPARETCLSSGLTQSTDRAAGNC